jgi:hypothetical protein
MAAKNANECVLQADSPPRISNHSEEHFEIGFRYLIKFDPASGAKKRRAVTSPPFKNEIPTDQGVVTRRRMNSFGVVPTGPGVWKV